MSESADRESLNNCITNFMDNMDVQITDFENNFRQNRRKNQSSLKIKHKLKE
jgi:glycine cleavage system regulatory protein